MWASECAGVTVYESGSCSRLWRGCSVSRAFWTSVLVSVALHRGAVTCNHEEMKPPHSRKLLRRASVLTWPSTKTSRRRRRTCAGATETQTEERSELSGKQLRGTPGSGGASTAKHRRSRKGRPACVFHILVTLKLSFFTVVGVGAETEGIPTIAVHQAVHLLSPGNGALLRILADLHPGPPPHLHQLPHKPTRRTSVDPPGASERPSPLTLYTQPSEG